jgi:hypothetical protein
MKKLLVCFSAGCLGALANSVTVWGLGRLGITSWAHVSIAPALSPAWLYPRIVWGGIWGLLFVISILNSSPLKKGMLISIVPTLFQLFIVFSHQTGQGVAGINLGLLTPLFVLFFNFVWGVVTALTLRFSR